MVYIVMGVSGCGKTTVGRALAARLGLPFYDADDHHPPVNLAKMRARIPLTDQDRTPWLNTLARHIARWNTGRHVDAQPTDSPPAGAVLACSALKQAYRDILSRGNAVRYLHLVGTREVIAQRLAQRSGHFFPAELLDSQFADLEPPPDATTLRVDQPLETQVRQALDAIGAADA